MKKNTLEKSNQGVRFKDKVVVVTGAASGIGAALCTQLGNQGAKLALIDLDKNRLFEFEKKLNSSGIETLTLVCDISNEKKCTSAVQKAIKYFGGIDILVNNAGITQRSAFINTDISVFRKVMDINFYGSLYATKASIDSLIDRKGKIVVISSIAGFSPLLGRSGYCASKHALHGLFSSLRTEMGNNIDITIVCPGFTRTNLQTRALDGDGSITDHPQSRIGKEMSPDKTAEIIINGIIKNKKLIVTSSIGKISYYINRLAPNIYQRIIENKFRKELQR